MVRKLVGSTVVLVLAAACTSSVSIPPGSGPRPGGVYRTAVPDFGLTDNLDPTGEYSSVGWEVLVGLVRTLVTYRHVAGPAGDVPVPDLAVSLPSVSSDGLTYAFTLKPDIRFGPPLGRRITSHDVEYAFERIDTPALVAQYGQFYDGTIVGMDGPARGPPTPISGIDTPDDQTIVFHLTRPTGDFLYRLTLPATAPIPEKVARCFSQAGQYGRDLIASGPYMLAGSDEIDPSSCETIRAVAGFDPDRQIVLVRNPDYIASSDSPTDRSNSLDGIEISVDTDLKDIFLKIEAGDLDGTLNSDSPPPDVLQRYLTSPDLRPYVHSNPGDFTSYLTMNLTTPPFDELHVRRAVSFVVDKAGLQRVLGGPIHGAIATHIVPPSLLGGRLAGYNPYPSPGNHGNVEAARDEMRRSTYDTDGDGLCDADPCKDVTLLNLSVPPYTTMEPVIMEDLAKIGIHADIKELSGGAAFGRLGDVSARVPIAMFPSYGKDYADPYSFLRTFSSISIQPTGGVNASLVGLTRERAAELRIPYPDHGVPSVDAQITTCEAQLGDARLDCWAALDRHLMEDVVPWVPYVWLNVVSIMGPTVTRYVFDQFSGNPSFTQIAVNNDEEPGV